MRRLVPVLLAATLFRIPVLLAAVERSGTMPTAEERVEVTATKYEDDPDRLPQSMTVVSGQDLRDRGATDLRSALALVAGVDIAPGSDSGPASAIPEMWGFREQDAYLLVVDGIPWGGVFNPQVTTLDLNDVERIEILRGAAPVMYGAMSFVGVIQVIRYQPGHGGSAVQAAAGSYGSAALGSSFDLSNWAGFASRLSLDAEKHSYRDERSGFERAHLLWRNRRELSGGGDVHFNLEGTWLNQSPTSPVPRIGGTFPAPNVPLDANYEPGGAYINPRRNGVSAGFTIPKSYGIWSGLASYARTSTDSLRGFVTDPTGPVFTANADRTSMIVDEVSLDAHVEITNVPKTQIVAGVDYQYGNGHLRGGDFDYAINADGSNPPDGASAALGKDANVTDTRNFGGLYGFAAWTPDRWWRVEAGLRANFTGENRKTSTNNFDTATYSQDKDSASRTRLGGSAGVTFTPWQRGADDVRLFADYRNTYKPAASEFDLDAAAQILAPETSESWELGVRTELFDRKFALEFSAFDMKLENLVLIAASGGFENAGAEKFKGFELEASGRLPHDIGLRAVGSYHDATFLDYQTLFPGDVTTTQLKGKRQEMTPQWLAGAGLVYAPAKGFLAHADVALTGSRYLNKRNTVLAPQFVTWGMGIGWRGDRCTIRLDGTNLGDQRDPVSESEVGDAQYYLLESRRILLSFNWSF